MPNKRLKRARQQIQSLSFLLEKQKLKAIDLEITISNLKKESTSHSSEQLLQKEILKTIELETKILILKKESSFRQSKLSSSEQLLQKEKLKIFDLETTVSTLKKELISRQSKCSLSEELLQKEKLKIIDLETKISTLKKELTSLQSKNDESFQLYLKQKLKVNKLEVQKKSQSQYISSLEKQRENKTKFEQKLQKLSQVQKLVQINKTDLTSTIRKYGNSNQFHVNPRLQMLNFCSKIISLFENVTVNNVKVDNFKILQKDQGIKFYIKQKHNPQQSFVQNSIQKKPISNIIKNSVFNQKSQVKKLRLEQKNKFAIKNLNQLKQCVLDNKIQLRSTIGSYSSSNYFHVGPRSHVFGFCRKVIKIAQMSDKQVENNLKYSQQLTNDNLLEQYSHQQGQQMHKMWKELQDLILNMRSSLQSTMSQYGGSNYFHVGPRYQILGFCRDLINYFQE